MDPWVAYRWLRDEAPVYWDPIQRLWAISRYDDVRAVVIGALRRVQDWELVDPAEPKILPGTFRRAFDRARIRFAPS